MSGAGQNQQSEVKGKIKPMLPGGFNDYSPTQMLARQSILNAIEEVYRRFAFLPLQTSIGQRREVLTGGKEIENRLWEMQVDKASQLEEVGLRTTARFDLTVPLARYISANIAEISWPFRRYEYGNVFRGESPQAGRYCQFMQFDADIVGAPEGPADAEIILCMGEVMRALDLDRYLIRINDRRILNGFAERFGFAAGSRSTAALLRILDKVDKIGLDGVLRELASTTPPPGEAEAFAFDEEQLNLVRRFMTLTEGRGPAREGLAALRDYFGEEGSGAEGVERLEALVTLLEAGGLDPARYTIDASIARGLGYYTGPIFETILLDKEEIGSVYSGGRYDGLVSRFTDATLPAVGASVGVDRLFAALESLGRFDAPPATVDLFIITMSRSLGEDYFRFASQLRAAGVRVEVNMNYQDSSNRAQMRLALKRGAPLILFYGKDDATAGTVGLRDTATRKQESVPRERLVEEVLQRLGR